MKLEILRKRTELNELHFTLTGEMNVYTSVKLKAVLAEGLKSSTGITLNLAGIDEADSTAFQLLLFLRRESEIAGKSFHVTGMSGKLNSIFSLYKEMI